MFLRSFSFSFLYKAYYAKHWGVLLLKHCKDGASVVTQILTHIFYKIFRKSKNSEKQWKSKKNVFNIFASFLAFSASFKKEFKFSKVFRTRSTFHASFFKIIIFLIWVDVDIARFQKNTKKLSKIKIYKKTKLRDQVWIPNNFLTYK